MTEENRRANVEAEVEKACATLAAAEHLLANGFADDAASRLYYAAFHMASAALLALGVEVTSHRGLTNQFALHLVRTGHFDPEHSRRLATIQGLRHHADYDRHFQVDVAGAAAELAWVRDFHAKVERFLAERGLWKDPGA